jgi:hypothetical protein
MLYIDIQNLKDFPKMRIIITLQFDIATMGASCMMNLGKEKGEILHNFGSPSTCTIT